MTTRTLVRNAGLMTLIIVMALIGAMLAVPAAHHTHAQQDDPAPTLDVSDLLTKAQDQGKVRLIVGVDTNFQAEGELSSPQAVQNQRNRIQRAQSAVLSSLPNAAAQTAYQFEFIPFMALTADTAALETLAQNPMVTSIEEDVPMLPLMNESIPIIGADNAHAGGYTGDGFAVAVLDTGVDNDHEFLQGSVTSEACYSTTYTDVGVSSLSVCPGGVSESTAPESGENCNITIDGCDHGTHVAGTVAGHNGPDGLTGVAPDAEIIAIQVFSVRDGSDVTAWTSDIIKGLERVLYLHNDSSFTTPIAAVNMSLGGGRYFDQATCDTKNAGTKYAIDNLVAANIAVVVASGNDGYDKSMGSPGCISSAVSVGSSNDDTSGYQYGYPVDEVSSFSNNADFLDLLAPGAWITSAVPGVGTYDNWTGTSMATPHVAGAWAVMREANSNASVADILDTLRTSGVPIIERRLGSNNRIIPRIQLDDAIDELAAPQAPRAPADVTALAHSSTDIIISWDDQSFNEDTFHLQRRTSGGSWTTVDDSISADNTSYIDSSLTCGDTYEYRVLAENSVGSSAWSSTDSAEPSEIETFTYTYDGSDVPIPTDRTYGYADIEVPSSAYTVTDIDVQFASNHPCSECLLAGIISPESTLAILVYGEGDVDTSFGSATFDDEAIKPIANSSASFSGSYQPEWLLSGLDDEGIDGSWTLFVFDRAGGSYGSGSATGFALDITAATGTCPPAITEGESTTVNMDEDGSPTDFALELEASDTDNHTLTWSILGSPGHGSANVDDGAGTTEDIFYTPHDDYNGSDSFVVRVTDSNGSTDDITVNVDIAAINDAPVFTKGADVVVPLDSGAQTVAGWARNMQPGPTFAGDELSQSLAFTVEVDSTTDSLAFDIDPAIDASSGDLTFYATDGTTGTATVMVWLSDDGPDTAPHVNTSAPAEFRINVGQNMPSGSIDDITVELSAADTIIDLHDLFSDPDYPDADLTFTVQENTNSSLVTTSIDNTAGTLTLQYAPDTRGTATITVRATNPDDKYADAVFMVTVEPELKTYIPLALR